MKLDEFASLPDCVLAKSLITPVKFVNVAEFSRVTLPRMFWVLIVGLALVTRLPVMAKYLSIDNVNLAYALEEFDPVRHQPQPPGYPLFVLTAKIVNVFFSNAAVTFEVLALAATLLCLPLIFALGRRLLDEWTGRAAVLLLLVNPVFWHSSLEGALRPNLALFSLLVGYCAWRAWSGERRFVMWGAVALGVGAGFRPDLLAYVGPVWLVSTLAATRSFKTILAASAVLAAIVLVWVGGLVYAAGGTGELYDLIGSYTVEQTRNESVVLGASLGGWLRQINRLVIWNGLAIVGWIGAVPLFLIAPQRPRLFSREAAFLTVWLVPGVIVQVLIHVAAPGHVLFSVPILCLTGAYVLREALRKRDLKDAALSAVLVVNVMLFMNFIPLPPAGSPGGAMDALRVGTFETSLEAIRWIDEIHGSTIQEIRQFTPQNREVVILAQDVQRNDWFLNWRIARYYFPDLTIHVLADQSQPSETFTVKGMDVSMGRMGTPAELNVPERARLMWLVGPDTPLRTALEGMEGIQKGRRVLYTDLKEGSGPLRVMNFLIIPGNGI
jgi:hypothetical protein